MIVQKATWSNIHSQSVRQSVSQSEAYIYLAYLFIEKSKNIIAPALKRLALCMYDSHF